MTNITATIIEQMNKEVTADNFESIVEKYKLETPELYSFDCISEHNGIEVWGIDENEDLLVYDSDNGFYLLSEFEWIVEVSSFLEDVYGLELNEYTIEEILKLLGEADEETQ